MPGNTSQTEQYLKNLERQFFDEVEKTKDLLELESFEKAVLGRKGKLTAILRALKDLPINKRRKIGSEANRLRQAFRILILQRKRLLSRGAEVMSFDSTEPGEKIQFGHIHPLTIVRNGIEEFFKNFGFSVIEGPELETDYYNFESLNMPPDHPARDMWDTFWVKSQNLLLRAHTSAMQVRYMEKHEPPLAVIVPGRTFRREATDARHEHTFDQVEGFMVGKEVKASHLKYLLHNLFRSLFGNLVEIKLRPSYFPFTEPSFELVMSCPFCRERGCPTCGNGWLEMLGAGMIHPKVFEFAGYKKGRWQGFAFGLGVARVAMLKYNIPDIRMFYENDLRFLRQF